MKDTGRVNVLEASKKLVEEKLDVVVSELLVALDQRGQICFHQLAHNINILEFFSTFRFDQSVNSDHVFVAKEALDFELSKSPLQEHFVVEGTLDFLDGH